MIRTRITASVMALSVHHLERLTCRGRVTHICFSRLTIIGSHNGLSPGRRQTTIWSNAGIVLIRPLRTRFSKTSIETHTFSFMLLCSTICARVWESCYSTPMVFQCRLQWSEFLQWHSSVGQFQLSFSSGVPVALQCTLDQPVCTGSG